MVFSKGFRAELSEGDARWRTKMAFRMLMNLLCIGSIGCAVYTLMPKSKFQPDGYEKARAVLVYLPCDGIAIAWNMINILHFLMQKRVFSNVTNIIVHFIMGTGFAIVGIYVTVVTWSAMKHMENDLYSVNSIGSHFIETLNGTIVLVESTNVASCPAFDSCADQNTWYQTAHLRALISVIGSFLFDAAFFVHVLFFLWSFHDAVFGTLGVTARVEARVERDRIRKWQDDHPILETSATNKSFDITAKPSAEVLARNGLMDLPQRNQEVDVGGRAHISRPVYTEHTTYTLAESGKEFTPAASRTFILRPASDSRESLSLAIFETTPTSMRPVSGLPTLPYTIPEEDFFDVIPPVPPLPPLSSSGSSQKETPPSSRHRKSSHASTMTTSIPSTEAPTAMDPNKRRVSSAYSAAQGTDRPNNHNHNPSQTSTHSATTQSSVYSRQSTAQIDYSQQPHPHYSYYRNSSYSRRTSSNVAAGNAPSMPPMTNSRTSVSEPTSRLPQQGRESAVLMADRQSMTATEETPVAASVSSKDSIYSKRESISALPPMPKSRDSQFSMKSMKSTKSTKPNKIRRKSTLRNVVSTENSSPPV